jgi:cytoskeletal protein CcmA (bactofilin family)
MFNRESRGASRIDMLISASAKVHGDVDFAGGLHIDGHVFGAVRAYGEGESAVSVGEGGIVEQGVVATHVAVNGIVRGDVQATGKVALGPGARVLGNVQYGTIESAAGAEIAGKLVQARPITGKVVEKTENTPQKALQKAATG